MVGLRQGPVGHDVQLLLSRPRRGRGVRHQHARPRQAAVAAATVPVCSRNMAVWRINKDERPALPHGRMGHPRRRRRGCRRVRLTPPRERVDATSTPLYPMAARAVPSACDAKLSARMAGWGQRRVGSPQASSCGGRNSAQAWPWRARARSSKPGRTALASKPLAQRRKRQSR